MWLTGVAFPAEPEYRVSVTVSSTRFPSFVPISMTMSWSISLLIVKYELVAVSPIGFEAGSSQRNIKLRCQFQDAVLVLRHRLDGRRDVAATSLGSSSSVGQFVGLGFVVQDGELRWCTSVGF